MSADPGESGGPRSRNWLMIVLAVVVVCCLLSVCCGVGWYLYTSGDQLFGLGGLIATRSS